VNELTDLDISKNSDLLTLSFVQNLLTKIDVCNNTGLYLLMCQDNRISIEELNAMFGKLHENLISGRTKYVYIKNNPGANSCDVRIAENKGWIVNLTSDF